ncbi:hypothetical protein F4557_005307 [Actinomadura catellatispora]|uniref:Uncharacterized protein n=1 Tax=Actinomadura livida TaxID=79909 RepID=A0A7W7IGW5_9ACTN|nr:hypothetical protein [Actinomadura catellatispora]
MTFDRLVTGFYGFWPGHSLFLGATSARAERGFQGVAPLG